MLLFPRFVFFWQVLDAVPDQDSFYNVVDQLEQLDMENVIHVSVASWLLQEFPLAGKIVQLNDA